MSQAQCKHGHLGACIQCLDEHGRKEAAELHHEAAQETIRAKIETSEIPERYIGAEFVVRNDVEVRYLELADTFIKKFPYVGSLMLCGNVGAGKTHYATYIGQGILKHHHTRTVIYTTAAQLFRAVKQTYNDGTKEQKVFDKFANPDLLIVDEMGRTFKTEFERNVLGEIVDLRYGKCRPSIICSNYTQEELTEFMGEPAIDRLKENGGLILAFNWGSRRDQKGVPKA